MSAPDKVSLCSHVNTPLCADEAAVFFPLVRHHSGLATAASHDGRYECVGVRLAIDGTRFGLAVAGFLQFDSFDIRFVPVLLIAVVQGAGAASLARSSVFWAGSPQRSPPANARPCRPQGPGRCSTDEPDSDAILRCHPRFGTSPAVAGSHVEGLSCIAGLCAMTLTPSGPFAKKGRRSLSRLNILSLAFRLRTV